MKPIRGVARMVLCVVVLLVATAGAYWLGYRAGMRDQGPQYRAIAIVRRTSGDPDSSGASFRWFDVSKASDAARLRREEERLKAIGADYYITEAELETRIEPKPDPRRADSRK